jgi:hypothetical protein
MSKLCERLELPAYPRPWEYLNRAICQISDHQQADIVRLRVPLLGAGGPALQKEVTVEYWTRAGEGENRPWSLSWEPVGGGPYPRFEGVIAIDSTDGRSAPTLVIEGEYAPPLGAAGQAFDLVLGSRIASITACEFLRSIAAQMQHEHTLERAIEIEVH